MKASKEASIDISVSRVYRVPFIGTVVELNVTYNGQTDKVRLGPKDAFTFTHGVIADLKESDWVISA